MAKKEKDKKKNKKNKKASKEVVVRKRILKSDYQKHQNRKINKMLGVPLDDETGFIRTDDEPKSFLSSLWKKDRGTDRIERPSLVDKPVDFSQEPEKLMLIKAREGEIKDKNKIRLSVSLVPFVEILSVVILCIYLLLIARLAKPEGTADFVNIVFIIIAHFMSTATLVGNDVAENGLNFTMYKTIVAAFHWLGASIIMFIMRNIYQPSAGGAVLLQIGLLGVAIIFYGIINMSKVHIIKGDYVIKNREDEENSEENDYEESSEYQKNYEAINEIFNSTQE